MNEVELLIADGSESLPLDLVQHFGCGHNRKPVQIGEFGDIALNAGDILSNLLHRLIKFGLSAPGDEDIRALRDESLCCRQTDATIPCSENCRLAFEFSAHCDFSTVGFVERYRTGDSEVRWLIRLRREESFRRVAHARRLP